MNIEADDENFIYRSFGDALEIYSAIFKLNAEQAADHLRSQDALEGALARPASYAHYQQADLPLQAAVLAHGIAETQPFVDGNKRTALIAMLTFLELNGYKLSATDPELAAWVISFSSGTGPARQAGKATGGLADLLIYGCDRSRELRLRHKSGRSPTSQRAHPGIGRSARPPRHRSTSSVAVNDFERLYGEDYGVVHRNGSVTISLPIRSSMTVPDRRVAFSGWVIGLVLGVMVSFFGILGHAGIVSEVLGGGAGIFVAFLVTILVLARSAHQQ